MSLMTRAVSCVAVMIFAAACAGDAGDTADTVAGTVDSAATATQTPDADRVDDRVEVALSTDTTLRGFGLDADEDDGKIVLKGAVRTQAQKEHAAMVAGGVAAGVTVDNRIRVDANARMSNDTPDVDDIEEQVEKAFEDDATLKPLNLDVDEDNGQIVLEGTAPAAQRTAAEELAKRIAGTVTVVNKIKAQ
jgi:osmotically-inducible protein OsmY